MFRSSIRSLFSQKLVNVNCNKFRFEQSLAAFQPAIDKVKSVNVREAIQQGPSEQPVLVNVRYFISLKLLIY